RPAIREKTAEEKASYQPICTECAMAGKRLVVVFGATGAQGGSVAAALLDDGTFEVRAVTRDTSKPAAVKLKEAGAEVVSADLDDEKSLEAALSGAYGAFVVTNAFEGSKKDKEIIQVR
ncbi:unnamed protein product, partial [Ranitomeya imitator]